MFEVFRQALYFSTEFKHESFCPLFGFASAWRHSPADWHSLFNPRCVRSRDSARRGEVDHRRSPPIYTQRYLFSLDSVHYPRLCSIDPFVDFSRHAPCHVYRIRGFHQKGRRIPDGAFWAGVSCV